MAWLNPTYLFALFAVPVSILLFLWASYRRRASYSKIGERTLIDRLTQGVSLRKRRWKSAFVVLALALMGLSLGGPRFGTKVKEVKREGVDLVIALDVSLSMQAEDIAPNRLDRSKQEIKKLLQQLGGDRVALVLFSGDAFIQCPLTTDYGAVRLFLDASNPSQIPTPGTSFEAAIDMAVQAFATKSDETEQRTKALLIISDGENHIGGIDELIQKATDNDFIVYTAGVGETEGVPIPVSTSGRTTVYKKDRQNKVVLTKLEEDGLKALAENGAYFRVNRTSSSLNKIKAALDRLDRTEFGSEEFEEYDEKFQWPLALALLLLGAETLLTDRKKKV